MKNMSWPVLWLIAVVVLVAGYFVGQGLHLDHKTAAPATSVVTVQPARA